MPLHRDQSHTMRRTALLLIALSSTSASIGAHFSRALRLTLFEQQVEDANSQHRIDDYLCRRLICLPITEGFASTAINGMHGKVQHGDKVSLPASIGRLIFSKPYEVPWLFEVTKVKSKGDILALDASNTLHAQPDESVDEQPLSVLENASPTEARTSESGNLMGLHRELRKAYVSPLDFRSPENYIFVPQWVMRSLGLKAFDVVDVSFVRIKLAALVVLQPLTLEWDDLVEGGRNPKSILETEVNKYSSLTSGSIITIEVSGVTYRFYVRETQAEGGVAVRGVRIQDSDVKVDIDRSILDEMKRELAEKQLLEEEEAERVKAKKKGRKIST